MIQVASSAQPAQARRRGHPPGLSPVGTSGNYTTGYMGREGRGAGARVEGPPQSEIFPMAFLVEQDPNTSLMSHFHIVDQFQVFTNGSGRLGVDPIDGVVVQFAGPYSPYGPIEAGAEGLSYFTFRNAFDPSARHMPACRAELPRPSRFRQQLGGPVTKCSAAQCAALTTMSTVELIALEADGLGSWYYRLPPGHQFTGPDPGLGRGQHWLVVAGELDAGSGSTLGPDSCIFLTADEPAFSATATAAGLEILVVQYPHRDFG